MIRRRLDPLLVLLPDSQEVLLFFCLLLFLLDSRPIYAHGSVSPFLFTFWLLLLFEHRWWSQSPLLRVLLEGVLSLKVNICLRHKNGAVPTYIPVTLSPYGLLFELVASAYLDCFVLRKV